MFQMHEHLRLSLIICCNYVLLLIILHMTVDGLPDVHFIFPTLEAMRFTTIPQNAKPITISRSHLWLTKTLPMLPNKPSNSCHSIRRRSTGSTQMDTLEKKDIIYWPELKFKVFHAWMPHNHKQEMPLPIRLLNKTR